MPSLSDRHILARGGNFAIGLATAASFADRVLAAMRLGTLALPSLARRGAEFGLEANSLAVSMKDVQRRKRLMVEGLH